MKATLHDHLNAEIAAGTLTSKQSCLEWLTWTYFFRRLVKNPSFYGLEKVTAESVNGYLIQIVEEVLKDLSDARLVRIIDEESICAHHLGYLSSYYYVTYKTAELFEHRIEPGLTALECMELMTEAEEYKQLPVRHNEGEMNKEQAKNMRFSEVKFPFESPHTKTYILLQIYFSRTKFPISDYALDAKSVIDNCARIIFFMVDIALEKGALDTSMNLILLAQQLVQGLWPDDPTLMCLPGFEREHARAAENKLGLTELCELAENKEVANELANIANLKGRKRDEMLLFVRRLPEIKVRIVGEKAKVAVGERFKLKVTLDKANFKESNDVKIRLTNKNKGNRVYLLIADEKNNIILEHAKLSFRGKITKTFEFNWPEGENVKIFILHDSYLGLDQEYCLNINYLNRIAGNEFNKEKDSEPTFDTKLETI